MIKFGRLTRPLRSDTANHSPVSGKPFSIGDPATVSPRCLLDSQGSLLPSHHTVIPGKDVCFHRFSCLLCWWIFHLKLFWSVKFRTKWTFPMPFTSSGNALITHSAVPARQMGITLDSFLTLHTVAHWGSQLLWHWIPLLYRQCCHCSSLQICFPISWFFFYTATSVIFLKC